MTDKLRESPSQMETCFAIFANVLELDDDGNPVNEKYAEDRAAAWLYQYAPVGAFIGASTAARRDLGQRLV